MNDQHTPGQTDTEPAPENWERNGAESADDNGHFFVNPIAQPQRQSWEPEFRGPLENQVKLIVALTAAMAEFKPIKKSADGVTGKQEYKYAPLANIIEAVKPALAAHGVGYTQTITSTDDPEDKRRLLTTIVCGHGAMMLVREWFLSNVGNPTQYDGKVKSIKDLGGLETYLRRYATQAVLFVEGDKDEDQNPNPEPYGNQPPSARRQQKPREQHPPKREPAKQQKPPATEPKPEDVSPPADAGDDGKPLSLSQKETIGTLYQRLITDAETKEQLQQRALRDIFKRTNKSAKELTFSEAGALIIQLQHELNERNSRDETVEK